MQDALIGADRLIGDDLAHQVGQGGGQFIRLGPAQHLGQVPLGICVHQKDFFTLPRKTNGKAGGCGGLADAAFLVCKGDCFHENTSNKKRSLLAPVLTKRLLFLYILFSGSILSILSLAIISLIRFRLSNVQKSENRMS